VLEIIVAFVRSKAVIVAVVLGCRWPPRMASHSGESQHFDAVKKNSDPEVRHVWLESDPDFAYGRVRSGRCSERSRCPHGCTPGDVHASNPLNPFAVEVLRVNHLGVRKEHLL
jgi:hypothetical protein